MQKICVKIKQLDEAKDLPLPKYMSEGAAGMDLYAAVNEDMVLEPSKIKLVPACICIEIPDGYEVQIRPRSGLALKHGIGFPNSPATIDSDYRGELKVIMMNWGEENFIIHRGDRIAQMILNKVEQIRWIPVEKLDETERNVDGFGHSGV